MRILFILLAAAFSTGICALPHAALTAVAADSDISLPVTQPAAVEGLDMDTAIPAPEINPDVTSHDLNAWRLDDPVSLEYGDRSFNFSSFRFQHAQEDIKAAVGDVNVQSSELIAPSLLRRGALLGIRKSGYSAEAFSVGNSLMKGFRYGMGQEDTNQLIIGGRITRTLLEDRDLRFTLHYLDIRDTGRSAFHPAASLQEGTVYSAAIEASIMGDLFRFSGEYCSSRHTDNSEDLSEAASDRAWRMKLFGCAQRFNYNLGYRYLGKDFRTIANPYAAGDRGELTADAKYLLDSSSISASILQSRYDPDHDGPLTLIRTGRIGYGLHLSGWPALSASQTLSTVQTIGEADVSPVDTVTGTTHFSISYTRGMFDLSPSYSISRLIDKARHEDGCDSRTNTARLACGIRPDKWISLHPVLTFRNHLSIQSGLRTKTYQGSLNGLVHIIPETLVLDTMISFLEKKCSDNRAGYREKKAGYRISWNMGKHIRKTMSRSLALAGEFMHAHDRLEESRLRNYTVSLAATIGPPSGLIEHQSPSSRFSGNARDILF